MNIQYTTPVEIPLSKIKLAKFLFFSMLFLACGLWMIIAQPEVSNPAFNNVLVKGLASYGGTLMGFAGICFFTLKLLDKRPGIILDEDGITNNSGMVARKKIAWDHIDGIFEVTIQASIVSKERFVAVSLKDPQQKADPMNDINSSEILNPVYISANGLNIKHEALFQLVKEKFEAYKSLTEKQVSEGVPK